MHVSLTPELEQIVRSKVETGHYNSASEVVREAIRLMNERDQINAMQKEEIRRKISAGSSSARAGRMSDGEVFMAQMEAAISASIDVEESQATHEISASK